MLWLCDAVSLRLCDAVMLLAGDRYDVSITAEIEWVVQCSAIWCSAVQGSTMHYSAVQYSAVQYNEV